MITIDIKSRTLIFNNLNKDCNFILQTCNLKHELSYQNVILSSLNYIEWDTTKLKKLSDNDMINWQIYSARDLSEEIIKSSAHRILIDKYLKFLETKYKTIPASHINRLEFLSGININNQIILKNTAQLNPNFYYTQLFLSTFKFAIDITNIEICAKYINTNELINDFIPFLSSQILEYYIQSISMNLETLKKIADTFNYNNLDRNRIWSLIFRYQKLPFQFIKIGNWTYDNWIVILKYQTITNEELLDIFSLPAGKTILQLACKFKDLDEKFITDNWDILCVNIILQNQCLSYEFVKRHIDKINIEMLIGNHKNKFTIVEIPSENEIIDISNKYIIVNSQTEKNNVLFID